MSAAARIDVVVDGTPVRVDGRGDSTLLMVHGWPDTLRLWDRQVDAFAPAWRCARFTLPGFDGAPRRPPPSLDATVALIGRVADAVSPGRPVALLVHDWGCVYGYRWATLRPDRVARIVGVDVGDAGSRAHRRSLGAPAMAAIASYQLWLALAWRIGGAAGDAMTRGLARALGAPGDPATIGAAMDYPYHLQWTGRYAAAGRTLAAFEPPCPMLYVYGRRKPFHFHSPAWADALAARPGCAVAALDTGHWPMRDDPDAFDRAVLGWLGSGA